MGESPASRPALCVPHSWGQGSLKSRDGTWQKSKAVSFPTGLLTVMDISHPSNSIKPWHHFFPPELSSLLNSAAIDISIRWERLLVSRTETSFSWGDAWVSVAVLAPQTAPQVWTWHACCEAKWQKIQWKQIVTEKLKDMNKIRICCDWFTDRSNKYKVTQAATALLQTEGFAQNKQESSLSSKERYSEATKKLLSRMTMMKRIMSPQTYLISNWHKLKRWMKLVILLQSYKKCHSFTQHK